ncbi:MAG: hypothetical protein ABGZ31_10985, partial [Roseibacillus sp.]
MEHPYPNRAGKTPFPFLSQNSVDPGVLSSRTTFSSNRGAPPNNDNRPSSGGHSASLIIKK